MSTSSPLVSILMTVYNREKYISQAIESVLASTYQNWELIIVDDQSQDRSVELARQFEIKDSRINVFVNEQNLGDYPNRNKAATYAIGKYLKYVDADDLIYPYGLEQLVYYMEQFDDAGYGLCSIEQDEESIFPIKLSPKEAYKRHYIYKKSIFHKAPLSAIINRDVFNQIGGFTGKRMLGDYEMWHILSSSVSVVIMPGGIVWSREHDEQEMALHRTDPFEPFKYILCSDEQLSSTKCPLNKNEIDICLKANNHFKAKSILSAYKNHSFKKGKQLRKASNMSWTKILTSLLNK